MKEKKTYLCTLFGSIDKNDLIFKCKSNKDLQAGCPCSLAFSSLGATPNNIAFIRE